MQIGPGNSIFFLQFHMSSCSALYFNDYFLAKKLESWLLVAIATGCCVPELGSVPVHWWFLFFYFCEMSPGHLVCLRIVGSGHFVCFLVVSRGHNVRFPPLLRGLPCGKGSILAPRQTHTCIADWVSGLLAFQSISDNIGWWRRNPQSTLRAWTWDVKGIRRESINSASLEEGEKIRK